MEEKLEDKLLRFCIAISILPYDALINRISILQINFQNALSSNFIVDKHISWYHLTIVKICQPTYFQYHVKLHDMNKKYSLCAKSVLIMPSFKTLQFKIWRQERTGFDVTVNF